MKWFKHDSNAHGDAKLKRVRQKYGMVGYGLYWYCIELIAGNVTKENITFQLEDDAEIIAIDWNLDQLKVEEMMRYFVEIGLFQEINNVITCLKLAKRLDDTNSKNPEIKRIINQLDKNNDDSTKSEEIEVIPTNSDLLGETPNISDQTRLDQNRLKDKDQKNKFSDADLLTAKSIFKKIKQLNPSHKEPNFKTWANDIRLMREQDKRTLKEILDLFRFANNDNFWQRNILSPAKLRKQWDTLTIQKNQSKPKSPDHDPTFDGVL